MGFISSIRKRSGLAVTLIALGLGLFLVGGDLLSPSSKLLNSEQQLVGEISGEDISYQKYQAVLEEMVNNYRMQTGKSPEENEMSSIQDQAWNQLIYDVAFDKEYDELGLVVTDEEKVDMVQGDNIHPSLIQAFTDPNTQQFNKSAIIQFLKSLDSYNPQMGISEQDFYTRKQQFLTFEQQLSPDRLRTKHINLLKKSVYVTKAEAKQLYFANNNSVSASFVYIPYYSIIDSTIAVSDEEIKNYINENKNEFQPEQVVNLEFVSFPIIPSSSDSAYVKDEISELQKEFETAENDSLFARANADNFSPSTFLGIGNLPPNVQKEIDNLDSGKVLGPYLDNDKYVLYKVSDIASDSIYSARASHILFKPKSQSEEDLKTAKDECEKILKEIQNGASFEEMAKIHGTDGTAPNGGDLGWFTEGRMVPEFNNVIFQSTKLGLVPNAVKTNFGYHIVKITGVKNNRTFKLTSLDRQIYTSDETRDQAYRKADVFAGKSKTVEEFDKAITEENLQKIEATNLKNKDRFLRGAGQARQVIRWAFNDAEVGDISQVFELEDAYIVALLTLKTSEDEVDIESVRDLVVAKIRNQKKAEQITQKLASLSGSVNEIANQYGADALVNSADGIKLSSTSINGIGFEPKAIGMLSGLKQGQKTEPIVGETGVMIFEVNTVYPAPDKTDFTTEKPLVANKITPRIDNNVFESVKDYASVKDERVKFY